MIALTLLQHFAASGECGTYNTVLDNSCLPHAGAGGGGGAITTVVNIVLGITAAIAVLVIVIAGLRYILARGDPNAVAQARNAIIYAIVGLVITMAAFAIVTFVVGGVS